MDKNLPKENLAYEELVPERKRSPKILLLIGTIVIVLVCLFVYYLISMKYSAFDNVTFQEPNSPTPPIVTPTPMPFAEMTIPYLRQKSYDSALGEMTAVSTLSTYTSYSTSYVSDGNKINAQLTRPTGEMPEEGWPAIIFVHGYIPPASYQTFANYSAYVDYFAQSGFVVFKIDLRGHGESEGEAGGAYYSSDYVSDVLHARYALQKSDFVNPDKIGLWGHSMAGNVTLRSAAVMPDIPAVAIWAGAVFSYEDWQKYSIQDGSYQPPANNNERVRKRELLLATHGQFDPKSAFWSQVAPTNYLSELSGAIELHHAVDDDVVNIGYSRDLSKTLEEARVKHTLFEYPSGGHNIQGSSFNLAMQRTVEFFKNNL